MGLSTDGKMGDDLVFVCSSSGLKFAWNKGKNSKVGTTGINVPAAELGASTVNGLTVCDFTVDEALTIVPTDETESRDYDLKGTQYYLLVATGTVHMSQFPFVHGVLMHHVISLSAEVFCKV